MKILRFIKLSIGVFSVLLFASADVRSEDLSCQRWDGLYRPDTDPPSCEPPTTPDGVPYGIYREGNTCDGFSMHCIACSPGCRLESRTAKVDDCYFKSHFCVEVDPDDLKNDEHFSQ